MRSGLRREELQRARHWASLRPVRRVAWPALPQAEWLAALVPLAAVRYARVAAPSSRARVPSRVPAAQRPAVETAVRVAWPSAVGAAEVVRSGAEAAAGVGQPDVAAAGGGGWGGSRVRWRRRRSLPRRWRGRRRTCRRGSCLRGLLGLSVRT